MAGTSSAGGPAGGSGGSSSGAGPVGGGSGAAGTAGSSMGGTATAGAGGGGAGGASGGGGSGGVGGAAAGHGAAAKFNCPAGATFGNPLEGMGSVNSIMPPPSDYFAFIEGPVWIGSLNTLFFSDNASSPTERVFKLVPPSTTPAVLIPDSGSNGLGIDTDDKIIATDQRNKRIVHFDPMSGQVVGTPVSTGAAKPNDVIMRSDGNVYFTDPDSGFYRIPPGGMPGAAMKFMQGSRPNGIVFSPDENTLYVGDVGGKTIIKYAVAADGSLSDAGAVFVAQTKNDTVDGLCLDCAGNVYASTSGGVEVYSSMGSYIGTVPSGEASNCTFGGSDRKTLYVTSRSILKSATLAVPGLPD